MHFTLGRGTGLTVSTPHQIYAAEKSPRQISCLEFYLKALYLQILSLFSLSNESKFRLEWLLEMWNSCTSDAQCTPTIEQHNGIDKYAVISITTASSGKPTYTQ